MRGIIDATDCVRTHTEAGDPATPVAPPSVVMSSKLRCLMLHKSMHPSLFNEDMELSGIPRLKFISEIFYLFMVQLFYASCSSDAKVHIVWLVLPTPLDDVGRDNIIRTLKSENTGEELHPSPPSLSLRHEAGANKSDKQTSLAACPTGTLKPQDPKATRAAEARRETLVMIHAATLLLSTRGYATSWWWGSAIFVAFLLRPVCRMATCENAALASCTSIVSRKRQGVVDSTPQKKVVYVGLSPSEKLRQADGATLSYDLLLGSTTHRSVFEAPNYLCSVTARSALSDGAKISFSSHTYSRPLFVLHFKDPLLDPSLQLADMGFAGPQAHNDITPLPRPWPGSDVTPTIHRKAGVAWRGLRAVPDARVRSLELTRVWTFGTSTDSGFVFVFTAFPSALHLVWRQKRQCTVLCVPLASEYDCNAAVQLLLGLYDHRHRHGFRMALVATASWHARVSREEETQHIPNLIYRRHYLSRFGPFYHLVCLYFLWSEPYLHFETPSNQPGPVFPAWCRSRKRGDIRDSEALRGLCNTAPRPVAMLQRNIVRLTMERKRDELLLLEHSLFEGLELQVN
ncbi:hypothetical protein SODALDRAFT_362902 [Sodiomyces alkalinus F11]|uniref:Uncharacterized protein n=1 Tax=Sodiomyces alkalinus (strain CBS 110278 / VKM F-3762 / F11) TaxID=1314773 RepID=A0A3N2PNC8_SODAK|nr:hypothetical protein SODALDRAFT_362902 [Sodiomyces alkalinus F11]ROT36041.1 hypothetical protein SODALDRAFT_362902 [Sodiomyces alkalinus F11]